MYKDYYPDQFTPSKEFALIKHYARQDDLYVVYRCFLRCISSDIDLKYEIKQLKEIRQ